MYTSESIGCWVKVGMVGDSQTGKTGLMARYVDRDFDPHYTETGAVCFHEKKEKIQNCDIKLSIWDVGGQAREVEQVCENASCILFVFDLSRPHTLNSIKDWHRKARAVNKHAYPILVGCKFDIFASSNPQRSNEISQEQAIF